MTRLELIQGANRQLARVEGLQQKKKVVESTISVAHAQMQKILFEQEMLEKTTVAVQQARPLLSASSIKQCEALANQAVSSIFELPYTVEWNVETQRFQLNKGDYQVDLVEAEGGGINSVIGFIFETYLLVKMGKRRVMFFDEAFTAVSDKYFPNFMDFIRKLCKSLNIDLTLVTHDSRITEDMVDHCYKIEGGRAVKLK